MVKKVTIASYDIDIEKIQKKLQDLQNDLSGSNMKNFVSKNLFADMDDLQKTLEKLRKTRPVANSSHKEVEKFLKEWSKISNELDVIESKLEGINFSDSQIKQNIKEISELTKKYKEAAKAKEEYAAKISSDEGVKTVTGGPYRSKLSSKRDKMAEAAARGTDGISDIKAIAEKERNSLKEKIDWVNQNRTSPEVIERETTAIKEQLKTWNAIEQSALRYAELQQGKIDAEKEANEEIDKQVQIIKTQLTSGLDGNLETLRETKGLAEKTADAYKEMSQEALRQEERQSNIDSIANRLKDMFSAATAISTIRHIVHQAIQDFQELDKQFNEIAIVSKYSTKEMWQSFSDVNKVAQDFGVETKNVLEVQNLYYHQGKNMAEVNKLTAQTLTLAKITGMDYERATSDLTAALNAYNIAAEDAVRVTDTIAAMDTNAAISSEELMTALTKTASIAANAGMSLESTEVFLTKMIETTREAPENLGTALKTIIARFGEVKQEIDGEEIELADINRVDTALKSIGISLLDTAGQIRDLDGVFMELSSKWDDLDRNTQRYIATMAAGSRQQSRFIAMMEDYDRTLELTKIAQDSAGLSARQLAKSQESIETSVNRLKSSWQEFYSSLITNNMIKGVLELANGVLGLVNKLNELSPFLGTIVAAFTIWGIKTQIVDKLIIKLGSSIGSAIIPSLGLGAITDRLNDLLNEEQRAALEAAGAYDILTESIVENAAAKKLRDTSGEPSPLGDSPYEANKNNMIDLISKKTKGKKLSGKGMNWGGEGKIKLFSKDGIIGNIGGKIKPLFTKITGFLGKISGAIKGIINFLGGPLTIAITAATTAFVAYRKVMGQTLDDTKKIKKLEKVQQNYNEKLEEYQTLKENIAVAQEAASKSNLTEEELTKSQEAIKAIVAEYPQYLDYIDEEGNYHLKNAKALDAEIQNKKELLDIEAAQLSSTKALYSQYGIYADKSTHAGAAMGRLQEFAGVLEEEQLKKIGRAVDAGNRNFNKSDWYAAMEAYASGEKASFGYKEFSDWFGGDIGPQSWDRLLKIIRDSQANIFTEKGINTTKFSQALQDSGAMFKTTADDVASTFAELDNQMGGLYSDILKGILDEYQTIVIQTATLQLERADLGFSDETNESVANLISQEVGELTLGEKARDWFASTDLGNFLEVQGATELKTKEATDKYVEALKTLTSDEIKLLDEGFTDDNLGGVIYSKIEDVINDIESEDPDKEEIVTKFYGQLKDMGVKGLPETLPKEMSTEFINVLYEKIISIISGIDTDLEGKFLTDVFGDRNIPDKVNDVWNSMSIDQKKATFEKTSKLSEEQKESYLNTLANSWAEIDSKDQSDFINKFLKIDFTNITTTAETAIEALREFGITSQDAMQMAVDAAGGIENISLGSVEDTIALSKELIESTTSGLEGMEALMKGEGSYDQVLAYYATMEDYWRTLGISGKELQENVAGLEGSIISVGNKFLLSAGDAQLYGNALVNTRQDIIDVTIAALKAIPQLSILDEEQRISLAKQIALLTNLSASLDGAENTYYSSGLEGGGGGGGGSSAKDKADALLESMKNLVEWLREFDRYANLDKVIESLEQEFEHTDFELNFTTNADVVKKDIEKQVSNINTRIAANQGGIRAAKDNMAMWRDTIEKRNSDYVSFDASGNSIVNAEKLQKLQEEISKADEEQKTILQAKYDEIMDNVEAYDESKEKVEEYTTSLEKSFSELKDILNASYDAITKVEDKLISVYQKKEDEELQKVKDKYEAIKEEDEKYLNSVQEMVNRERAIRDRANNEQEVKDKEKKLAMMRMDTSGVYTGEIRSLEQELEQDYQNLEDNAVDDAISELERQSSAQAEVLDREIEYFDNALAYKREKMTEYNEWANQLLMQGSDAVLAYLKANDAEYYTGTAAAQAAWSLEWNNAVAQAVGANQLMQDSLLNQVYNSLDACTQAAGGFEKAVQQYSSTAMAENGLVKDSISTLTDYYGDLATGVSGVSEALSGLEQAYSNAAAAAERLAGAQSRITGVPAEVPEIDDKGDGSPISQIKGLENLLGELPISGTKPIEKTYQYKDMGVKVQPQDNFVLAVNENAIKGKSQEDYVRFTYRSGTRRGYFNKQAYFKKKDLTFNGKRWLPKVGAKWYKQYATGGIADFTGPAWLDGTPSKPEMVLNPLQTQHFIQLVDVLDSIFSKPIISSPRENLNNPTSKGDIYNFNIEVSQMASDYDVDKLVNRVEEKMVKAGQYRQVTKVTKSR